MIVLPLFVIHSGDKSDQIVVDASFVFGDLGFRVQKIAPLKRDCRLPDHCSQIFQYIPTAHTPLFQVMDQITFKSRIRVLSFVSLLISTLASSYEEDQHFGVIHGTRLKSFSPSIGAIRSAHCPLRRDLPIGCTAGQTKDGVEVRRVSDIALCQAVFLHTLVETLRHQSRYY